MTQTDSASLLPTLRAGSPFFESRYALTQRDGSTTPEAPLEPLGSGGSGIVYRAQRGPRSYAIKLLYPEFLRGLAGAVPETLDKWREYLEAFHHEGQMLQTITHSNLAKIVDSGLITLPGVPVQLPLHVTELVDGPNLIDALSHHQLAQLHTFDLLSDVVAALAYLHSHNILHSDIKPANIHVDLAGERPRAILLDLGVARPLAIIPELESDPKIKRVAYFYSSRAITRVDYHHYRDAPAALETFRKILFPDHDLFGFGLLLRDVIALPEANEALKAAIGREGLAALSIICDRLLGPQHGQYPSAAALRDDILKLTPAYSAPFGVPELAPASSLRTAIRIPTERIELSERMVDLLDNPLLQRLRRLKQLGFVYLINPGARHSRLTYALARYGLTKQFIWSLLASAPFRLLTNASDLEALLLYSLVSEVRHYPLAHVFEDLGQRLRANGLEKVASALEGRLERSLLLPQSQLDGGELSFRDRIMARVSGIVGRSVEPLSEAIAKRFSPSTVARLSALVTRDCQDPTTAALLGLLDSPIDAGKLAYLRLDSLMSGVGFGAGVDLDGILATLRTPSANHHLRDGAPVATAALRQAGRAAAESAILARLWMIQQVYWSPANRAAMAQISFHISTLLRCGLLDPEDFLDANLFASHEQALQWLISRSFENRPAVETMLGGPILWPATGLVDGARGIYRALVNLNPADPADKRLIDYLGALTGGERDSLRRKLELEAGSVLDRATVGVGAILFDLPPSVPSSEGRLLVYAERDQAPQDIFDVSPMLREMRLEYERHGKTARVFAAPELLDGVSDATLGVLRRTLKNCIRVAAGVDAKPV